jgi:DNA-nicking Smr family endonuclease
MSKRPPSKLPLKSLWHPPLAPEDVALWENVKKTVKRIQNANPKNKNKEADAVKLPLEKLITLQPKPEKKEKASVKTVKFSAPASSFDRIALRKIKSGQMKIEDSIDLHGMRQEGAHRALENFMISAHTRRMKLVLVITGKGDRFSERKGEGGVLRKYVPLWLKETKLRHLVLSFSKASIAHGGEGAFYVRLRKRQGAQAYS